MTMLFMDGFDHYGSGSAGLSAMLNGVWATIPTNGNGNIGVPSWGAATGILSISSSGFSGFKRVLPAVKTALRVSFRASISQIPTTNNANYFFNFINSAGSTIASVGVESTGAISFYCNGTFTTQGPVMKASNWQYFEMILDLTAQTFTLRVDDAQGNGAPVLSVTNVNPTNAGPVAVIDILDGPVSEDTVVRWIDDLIVCDTLGTQNNGFMGDRRVATLPLDADSTPQGWTPSFYKEFGQGILTLGFKIPNSTTIQNNTAFISSPSAAALDIGASDFTLESMVRFDALPALTSYSTIFSRWDQANNRRSYRLVLGGTSFNNGCLQFDTCTDGTSSTIQTPIVYPWTPQLNTWYHIALVRVAGELLLFVNGQQFGLPIADTRSYFSGGTEVFAVGAEVTGTGTGSGVANSYTAGRFDETRFTNGVGRYTGPFAPPTAAFPRGNTDPDWTSVVFLAGYDSGIHDESSFNRTVASVNGAVSTLPNDGPLIGNFSTIGKTAPDDNTFIGASLVNATNILTMTAQPTNGDTVTVGTKDGTIPAVYTFKTALAAAFDVLIDTSAQSTLINLFNAINAGPGLGTKYGTGTVVNFDVNSTQLPVGQIQVSANTAGTIGNSIPSTSTGSAATWATTTLTNGSNIPAPSNFRFQRPPSNTTIISALQTVVRASKTDSGLGSFQASLIGPLGTVKAGANNLLTISPDYYSDIIEVDPDTQGPISPTTIINGQLQINRTQ